MRSRFNSTMSASIDTNLQQTVESHKPRKVARVKKHSPTAQAQHFHTQQLQQQKQQKICKQKPTYQILQPPFFASADSQSALSQCDPSILILLETGHRMKLVFWQDVSDPHRIMFDATQFNARGNYTSSKGIKGDFLDRLKRHITGQLSQPTRAVTSRVKEDGMPQSRGLLANPWLRHHEELFDAESLGSSSDTRDESESDSDESEVSDHCEGEHHSDILNDDTNDASRILSRSSDATTAASTEISLSNLKNAGAHQGIQQDRRPRPRASLKRQSSSHDPRRERDSWESDSFSELVASGYTIDDLIDLRVGCTRVVGVSQTQLRSLLPTKESTLYLMHVLVLAAWVETKFNHANDLWHMLQGQEQLVASQGVNHIASHGSAGSSDELDPQNSSLSTFPSMPHPSSEVQSSAATRSMEPSILSVSMDIITAATDSGGTFLPGSLHSWGAAMLPSHCCKIQHDLQIKNPNTMVHVLAVGSLMAQAQHLSCRAARQAADLILPAATASEDGAQQASQNPFVTETTTPTRLITSALAIIEVPAVKLMSSTLISKASELSPCAASEMNASSACTAQSITLVTVKRAARLATEAGQNVVY